MDKTLLLSLIIDRLQTDLTILERAALSAHEAATDAENVPDNKYETLALEASYIAQGQANRAQQIRLALGSYKKLESRTFRGDEEVRLTAMITLEDGDGKARTVFLGPAAGGLKIQLEGQEVTVITPDSPLGRSLLGKQVDDSVELEMGTGLREYEIVAIG